MKTYGFFLMDEESIVGKDTIVGIVNFIRRSRSTGELIGQGKTTAKTMEHTLPQNNIQNPAKPHIKPHIQNPANKTTTKTIQHRSNIRRQPANNKPNKNNKTLNKETINDYICSTCVSSCLQTSSRQVLSTGYFRWLEHLPTIHRGM